MHPIQQLGLVSAQPIQARPLSRIQQARFASSTPDLQRDIEHIQNALNFKRWDEARAGLKFVTHQMGLTPDEITGFYDNLFRYMTKLDMSQAFRQYNVINTSRLVNWITGTDNLGNAIPNHDQCPDGFKQYLLQDDKLENFLKSQIQMSGFMGPFPSFLGLFIQGVSYPHSLARLINHAPREQKQQDNFLFLMDAMQAKRPIHFMQAQNTFQTLNEMAEFPTAQRSDKINEAWDQMIAGYQKQNKKQKIKAQINAVNEKWKRWLK